MSIKKQYVELIHFLEQNSDKKVKTILDELKQLCESKQMSSTNLRNSEGDVVAIFCYYHKQFEDVKTVEYGLKANSTTGLNTMCKVGTSAWTKQQAMFKKLDSELLTQVMNGDIDSADVKTVKQVRIDEIISSVAAEKQVEGTTVEELTEKYGLLS